MYFAKTILFSSVFTLSAAFSDVAQAQTDALDLPAGVSALDVFVENCAICHGVAGAGDGDLAPLLSPRPRNLNVGNFKFRSTGFGQPPSQADLIRTITQGIAGPQGPLMPPFDALTPAEIFALTNVIREFAGFDTFGTKVDVPARPATLRVADGQRLFVENGCNQCHGDDGAGDGISAADLRDENNLPIAPANLQTGAFKGGNAPEDIFLRIQFGIDGTPMPSFGRSLSPGDIWALTDFVESLSGQN